MKNILTLFCLTCLIFLSSFGHKVLNNINNTNFEIVNRIKKRNPSDCSLASYHRSSDHYRVICIGKNLNRSGFLKNIICFLNVGAVRVTPNLATLVGPKD